jgi:predicted mannosyl-3-phosphoglycerate phosphatase (HAD superfamily)
MATRILLELYRSRYGSIISFGIGDSQNDVAMLMEVDRAYLVQKPDGTHQQEVDERIVRAEGIGPIGWNNIVNELLAEYARD